MHAKDLRNKTAAELNDQLLELRREQFNLRMQRAQGQSPKPHMTKRARRDVARVKTVLAELKGKG